MKMVDSIPSRVMTLRGDSLLEFIEAIESLQIAISIWGRGEKVNPIQRVPGRRKYHPIALIRKHMATLSDEGIDPTTSNLSYISDAQFQKLLRTDITAMNSTLDNGEWKAGTILAGSIIEAMLLYVVKEYNSHNSNQAVVVAQELKTKGIINNVPSDIDEWALHQLTEVALMLSIISETTAAQCRIAREFRNLVHPGRAIRLAQVCDRGTALSAVAAVEHVIRDLSKP